jgi:Polyketide cyclase / dehydrase and lipid transport
MPTLTVVNQRTIAVPVERAWHVVADEFESVGRWASGITHSTPNPAAVHVPAGADSGGRVCHIPAFGVTDERIVEFDPVAHVLAYSATATKMPGFVHDVVNRWTVRPAGPGSCLVTSSISARASGVMGALAAPMLRMQFTRTIQAVLDDFDVYARTGDVSDRKRRSLARSRA